MGWRRAAGSSVVRRLPIRLRARADDCGGSSLVQAPPAVRPLWAPSGALSLSSLTRLEQQACPRAAWCRCGGLLVQRAGRCRTPAQPPPRHGCDDAARAAKKGRQCSVWAVSSAGEHRPYKPLGPCHRLTRAVAACGTRPCPAYGFAAFRCPSGSGWKQGRFRPFEHRSSTGLSLRLGPDPRHLQVPAGAFSPEPTTDRLFRLGGAVSRPEAHPERCLS
jgi:hypothetical protein